MRRSSVTVGLREPECGGSLMKRAHARIVMLSSVMPVHQTRLNGLAWAQAASLLPTPKAVPILGLGLGLGSRSRSRFSDSVLVARCRDRDSTADLGVVVAGTRLQGIQQPLCVFDLRSPRPSNRAAVALQFSRHVVSNRSTPVR